MINITAISSMEPFRFEQWLSFSLFLRCFCLDNQSSSRCANLFANLSPFFKDKNLDQPEVASERFKEIRHAYSILKDANERAWYDSHREQILRGGTSF
jgi:hypothetical protein